MRYLTVFLLIPFLGFAQQTEDVDFLNITSLIRPLAEENKVQGEYTVTFMILKKTDSIYLDAVNTSILKLYSDTIKVVATDDKLIITSNFQAGKTYQLALSYEAYPKQTLYFTGNQIWTQGQGKYTSHWLPSIDDMNDKIEFDLSFHTMNHQTVIANGSLQAIDTIQDSATWRYDMKQPMASYLVAFAMGDFNKKKLTSKSGVPLELYYSLKDSTKAEPTYRYSLEIFDYLEETIGVAYPWQNYKQVPVRDFLYAGMENTGCTIFSEAFVVDSIAFNDRNYVNVNAHELAHQWFGNLVTETESTHHWLHEGFATYYAYLAEREIFGDDYYYWKLFNTAERLQELSDKGKGERLLNPKASSLTFYEKGAWALHILNEMIGEEAFKTAVKSYLEKHQYKNVTTQDFLAEIRKATEIDITEWEKDWLQQSAFKAEQAYQSLRKSKFMNDYFEIAALRAASLNDKVFALRNALTFPNDFIGQEAVYQLANEPISETLSIYKKAFESNNLFVRQAIVTSLPTVPIELKSYVEKTLNDESYVTQEAALYALWSSFPKDRVAYLDAMKNREGFQNKNIRQLWLALAIVTPNYAVTAKPIFKKELQGYTSNAYSFEIRQTAFEYVSELGLYNEKVLANLINASVHPNWRFRNASRKSLDEVLKTPGVEEALKNNLASFSEKERNYLQKKLSE